MTSAAADETARSSRVGHLVRRLFGSLSRRPPAPPERAWAEGWLLEPEQRLWRAMTPQDQRHAVVVARRFEARRRDASRAEMAAALLHDIGKVDAGLGTMARVIATLVGPRGGRFRLYHEHERRGADRLAAVGSDRVTVELLRGVGAAAAALRAADDV
jgi:hypothetical protein